MIILIKKVLILLTNSIRKKLIFCFMLIIILLISVSTFTYFSGKALNDIYNSTLEKHLYLNDLFVNLGATNELYTKYIQSGVATDYEKYNKAYPLLLQSSQKFVDLVNLKKYNRSAIDFKYMIQSYVEEANASIVYMNEKKLDITVSHNKNAKFIFNLINENFKKVYSIVLEDTDAAKAKIIENRRLFFTYSGFLIVFLGAFCIAFMQWFSVSLTKPINSLTLAASRAAKGDMASVELPITTHDEVSILTLAFNKMIFKIDQQISEIKEKAEIEKKLKDEEMENLKIKNLLKGSELKALQSRINPHFLFNSLNMISQMSYIEGAVQTTSLLESMADLLRYNLDKFSKVVTIKDEIGNLNDYVFIQRKRFGERIRFEIKEEPEANNSMIPCLIIQPLVENSIIHGVGLYTEDGVVSVEVKKVGERVILRIYDNGLGIEKNKLERLNQMIAGDFLDNTDNGIGIHNVCARLKIFYNNDLKISIKSDLKMGTEIELDLPYKVKGDSEL